MGDRNLKETKSNGSHKLNIRKRRRVVCWDSLISGEKFKYLDLNF